jgi:hypothetical protein
MNHEEKARVATRGSKLHSVIHDCPVDQDAVLFLGLGSSEDLTTNAEMLYAA